VRCQLTTPGEHAKLGDTVRDEVYALINKFDHTAESLTRDQRVRQALADLRNASDLTCMCEDGRDMLRGRVVRAAVLAVDEYERPKFSAYRDLPLDIYRPVERKLRQKYTLAEANTWADHPWREESMHFVRAFLGNPNFEWSR